jgi:acetyl-CoA carboxylase carboxyl transferase subunit alpha
MACRCRNCSTLSRPHPTRCAGAHRNPEETIQSTGDTIQSALSELAGMNTDMRQARRDKFLAIGRGL